MISLFACASNIDLILSFLFIRVMLILYRQQGSDGGISAIKAG